MVRSRRNISVGFDPVIREHTNDGPLEMLVELGLTPTEAKVYSALLSLGGGTTTQISIAASKERSQTHHALEKLQHFGIVNSTLGIPTKFEPVEIKDAVDHLFSLQSVKLQKLQGLKAKLIESLVSGSPQDSSSPETYSIVKGRVNTYLKMIDSIQSSTKEVSLILSAKGLTRLKRFKNFFRVLQSRHRKGVNFRVISEITSENLQDAKAFGLVTELRHVKTQITNASIYDEKIGSVALSISEDLNIDASDHIALWTNAQSFAKTLNNFFEAIWFVAAPAQPTIRIIESGTAE